MAEKKKRIASLEKELRRHRQLYYNEQPEISDAEFDELVDAVSYTHLTLPTKA